MLSAACGTVRHGATHECRDTWLTVCCELMQDAWAEAERAAQQTAVDEALYSDEGWAPAAGPGGLLDEEGLSVPPWQREFYPTAGEGAAVG
jgi:hypothetical protein